MMTSAFLKNLFTRYKMHGGGEAQVILSDAEVYTLLCIAIHDLGWSHSALGITPIALPSTDYYQIPLSWFEQIDDSNLSAEKILITLDTCIQKDRDFSLYLDHLASLHRRRVKYKRILSQQPLPTMDQIGPRVLLEYGCCEVSLLANWMIWRKWLYDLDNRSAQETGYLFEPVLTSCLGGESIAARNSPIKRLDAEGQPTEKGRQVDCLVPATQTVYEFKLRVTIAASGQGRFPEERSFPAESQAAGYRPILLVLDPTPSTRLTELSQCYLASGGTVYQGEAAWHHLEQQAGPIVSVFIANYIKPALQAIESINLTTIQSLTLSWNNGNVEISNGETRYSIDRSG
jgi:hypothetical protein